MHLYFILEKFKGQKFLNLPNIMFSPVPGRDVYNPPSLLKLQSSTFSLNLICLLLVETAWLIRSVFHLKFTVCKESQSQVFQNHFIYESFHIWYFLYLSSVDKELQEHLEINNVGYIQIKKCAECTQIPHLQTVTLPYCTGIALNLQCLLREQYTKVYRIYAKCR